MDALEVIKMTENYFNENIDSNFDHRKDWFYEGKVSQCVVNYLRMNGYEIDDCDHNSNNPNAHGIDIKAYKDNLLNLIEVKGYPSEYYTKGEKKGKKKKTRPNLQAKHWFSECILSSIFNYSKYAENGAPFKIGMAFPDFPEYKKMIKRAKPFFVDHKIDVDIYLVEENGRVHIDNLQNGVDLTS